jgi:hypothetical protein
LPTNVRAAPCSASSQRSQISRRLLQPGERPIARRRSTTRPSRPRPGRPSRDFRQTRRPRRRRTDWQSVHAPVVRRCGFERHYYMFGGGQGDASIFCEIPVESAQDSHETTNVRTHDKKNCWDTNFHGPLSRFRDCFEECWHLPFCFLPPGGFRMPSSSLRGFSSILPPASGSSMNHWQSSSMICR